MAIELASSLLLAGASQLAAVPFPDPVSLSCCLGGLFCLFLSPETEETCFATSRSRGPLTREQELHRALFLVSRKRNRQNPLKTLLIDPEDAEQGLLSFSAQQGPGRLGREKLRQRR